MGCLSSLLYRISIFDIYFYEYLIQFINYIYHLNLLIPSYISLNLKRPYTFKKHWDAQ